jgi:hypothetical protein
VQAAKSAFVKHFRALVEADDDDYDGQAPYYLESFLMTFCSCAKECEVDAKNQPGYGDDVVSLLSDAGFVEALAAVVGKPSEGSYLAEDSLRILAEKVPDIFMVR